MTTADRLALASDFPAATADQWRALVGGVLRRSGVETDDVEAALASPTYDGFDLKPLYTARDGASPAGFPGLPPFVRGGTPAGQIHAGWDVRQRHAHPDPATTTQAILADLENGGTSLWLVAGASGLPVDALADVLAEVYLDLAPVTLDAGHDLTAAAEALLAVYADKGVRASEVRGNLGADPIGLRARTGTDTDLDGAIALAVSTAARYPRLRALVVDALPYHEAGSADSQELGYAIATGVAYLRALTAAGLDVPTAAGLVEFRLAATVDQFATIAKLRAARRLWARVTEVCGAGTRTAPQHAVTSSTMTTRRDPWVNMLRTTIACFAAGVGGADAVTVLPFDAALGLPDAFARRIARNTQSILIEESKVAGVLDPAGGSWYLERRTDELAHAGWAVFTELERTGGIVAALDSGLVDERIAATRAARTARYAEGAEHITGVTSFPDEHEKPLVRQQAPAQPGGGLPKIRYAEPFEEAQA
ncbi:methylmalonyl-CoA mutase subunit beta [Actinophytocola sediminis]